MNKNIMTTRDACQTIGVAIILILIEGEGHQAMRLVLSQAVTEVFFEGRMDGIDLDRIKVLGEVYGTDTILEACHILANRMDFNSALEDINDDMTMPRVDLTRALVRNNWTLHKTYKPEIWDRIGHLPCDTLGMGVWYVTDQNQAILGHSQLSDDAAIERAIQNTLERAIAMKNEKAQTNLSQAHDELVHLCNEFSVTPKTEAKDLEEAFVYQATIIRVMYTDFTPDKWFAGMALDQSEDLLSWINLLLGWTWPEFNSENMPKFYVQLTATRVIGIQINPDSSVVELAEAYWGDFDPEEEGEPTTSQVGGVESVYIQLDHQLTSRDIKQAVTLRDPDGFLTTEAKAELYFGLEDDDV
jgi:hypothetical protein